MNTPLLTVRDYLRVIFRRKTLLFTPIVLGAMLVAPLWTILPSKYSASALVKRTDLAAAGSSAAGMTKGVPTATLNTLRVEILTYNNIERVIRQLNMDRDLRSAADWQTKFEELRKAITLRTVAEGRGVDLIEISAIAHSPVEAQRIANAIADNYIEESKRSDRTLSQRAVSFLEESTNEYLQRLRRLEQEIDDYRQKNYTDLPEVKRTLLERLHALRTNETALSLQLTSATNRLAEIDKQIVEVEATLRTETTTLQNPDLAELHNELLRRRRMLDQVLVSFTEEHPTVKQLRGEIEALAAQLKEQPSSLPGSERAVVNPVYQQLALDRMAVQQEIRSHEATLREIRAGIVAHEERARKVVSEEKRYSDLVRQRDECAQVYNQYRQDLQAARTRLEVQAGEYGTDVVMQQRAIEPASPTHMIHLKMAFACLGLGMGVGVGLMVAAETCDHSLRSAEDAAAYLNVRVLGSLSTITTPEDTRRRRRMRWTIMTIVALILVGLFAGGLAVEHARPGTLAQLSRPLSRLLAK